MSRLDQSFEDEGMLFIGKIEDIRDSSESASSVGSSAEMFRATLKKNLSARFEDEATTASNVSTAVKTAVATLHSGSMTTVPLSSPGSSKTSGQNQGRTKMMNPFQICMPSSVKAVPPAVATTTARPPLHTNSRLGSLQLGMISKNRFSVLLRIRPVSSSSGSPASSTKRGAEIGTSTVNTIEIIEDSSNDDIDKNNIRTLPTKIRTYPPTLSNSIRINVNRQFANNNSISSTYAKEFEFDGVLGPSSSQQNVYAAVAAPLIEQVLLLGCSSAASSKNRLEGSSTNHTHQQESALIFSYGITNAGKTHTIIGDLDSKKSNNWGIIPRALSHVLDHLRLSSTDSRQQPSAELYVSFFEIYNEQVYDLVPEGKTSTSNDFNSNLPQALKVRECCGQVVVRGLKRYKVSNIDEGIALAKLAHEKRHTSSNNLNKDSSRSHFICQMQIIKCHPIQPSAVTDAGDGSSVSSSIMAGYTTDEEVSSEYRHQTKSIWIVDLAGSERSKRTNVVSSTRQKESIQINQSLMTLMICLNGINESGKSGSNNIIPYRNSKLTHIFQSHFTSMSAWRTAMIVNVNPAVGDFDETQHVLAYARTAKLIKLKPEEFGKKRKQYFGCDSYDLNGRKRVKPETATNHPHPAHNPPCNRYNKTIKGFVSRMVEKLSPTRSAKNHTVAPNQLGHSSTSMCDVSIHHQNSSCGLPSSAPIEVSASSSEQQSILRATDDKATVELQLSLEQARQEISRLEIENKDLRNRMAEKEEQIRSEVAEEMEEMLRVARVKHKKRESQLMEEIEVLKNANSSQSIKRGRAELELDELMDKYIESESEMARMNKSHKEEIASKDVKINELQNSLKQTMSEKEEIAARMAEIEHQQLIEASSLDSSKKSRCDERFDDTGGEDEENESEQPLKFNNFTSNKSGSTRKDRLRKKRRPLGVATNTKC